MRAPSLALALLLLGAPGCKDDSAGSPDGGAGGAGAGGGGAGGGVADAGLTWFTTCGDPVCRGVDAHRPMPDVAPCTTQRAGQPCANKDEQCDPIGACNEALRCSDHDPKVQPGGCPISSRRFKTEITYLDAGARRRIAGQVASLRLARYRYRDDPAARPHLGFILEDAPDAPASDVAHERVDLYAYLSMVVATLQTQQEELAAQRQEIARLRARLARTTNR